MEQLSWQQITDQRTGKQDRDLDHTGTVETNNEPLASNKDGTR